MSANPTTPSPNAKSTDGKTTDDSSGTGTPVRLFRFDSDILHMVVELLGPDDDSRQPLLDGIDRLFNGIGVLKWDDLRVFSSEDIASAITSTAGLPGALSTPRTIKTLGYIVDYSEIGTLTVDLSIGDIISAVKALRRGHSTSASVGSPIRKGVQILEKKTVPNLAKFSGLDEDFFSWKTTTMNTLGVAGHAQFLSDDTMTAKHPDVAESLFYAFRAAVDGGQAQYMAQGLLDSDTLDPTVLWKTLMSYYDTAINRANVSLYDTRRLLDLTLHPETTASKFVTEFRGCLQRLRKNNKKIADDKDFIRALILGAIKDDDYDIVRDIIIRTPEMPIETMLNELRTRENALRTKEETSTMGGDGVGATRYSRRTTQPSGSPYSKTSSTGANSTPKKWSIPKFPDSWKSAIGAALFKMIIDWRTAAHKGNTQQQLNDNFSTVVETYTPSAPGAGKKNNNKKSKTRRASKSPDPAKNADSSVADGETIGSDSADADPDRKRIRLQKSRRVVTETASK
jgi:hypothetical protein